MCAALGVTKGMADGTPPYVRVLAASGEGRALLREMDEKCALPVITKPAAARSLPEEVAALFELSADAHDLYVLGGVPVMIGDRRYDIEGGRANGMDTIGVCYGYGAREERRCGGDWRRSPFLL